MRAKTGFMERKLGRSEQRLSEAEAENRVLREQLGTAEKQQVRISSLLERRAAKKTHKLRWLVLGGLLTWVFGTDTGRRRINSLAEERLIGKERGI